MEITTKHTRKGSCNCKRCCERRLNKINGNVPKANNETTLFTGRIKRFTDKAILFHLFNTKQTVWLPLSQCTYLERSMGPLDQVFVPDWLVEAKSELKTELTFS